MSNSPDLGPKKASLRQLHAHRHVVGMSYRYLLALGILSTLAGLGQAGLLIVVVRIATALTAETEQIAGTIGPLTATDLTTTDLLWFGSVILGALIVVEVAASRCHARLYALTHRTTQRHLLNAFSNAEYAAQSTSDRGDTQQLLHVHAGQAAALVNALGSVVSAAANFFVLVVAAVVLSPVAAIAVLGGLTVMLVLLRPLLTKSKEYGDARASNQRAMASLLAERLELNREVRSFGVEVFGDEQIHTQIDAVASSFERLRFISRVNSVAYRLGAFGLILAMLAVIQATASTSLAALTGALLMLLRSLSYGQATQGALQATNEALPVVDQLLVEFERLDGAARTSGRRIEPLHMGSLQLDDVSFVYPHTHLRSGTSEPANHALTSIDMEIPAGEFVALVGPSGSGKSTLISLLLGLRRPTSGQILLGTTDIADIDPHWWHQRVAFVPQEPRLSSGTVLEAIRFGRSEISDDAVKRAAARAHIAEEIESWPNGWVTQVGTLGEQLSGGQRQRVAIARAIAGDPQLLLLDEPTSALDQRSEALISNTITSLRGHTTIVAIAHRPRTIEHADRVVRITDGRLALENPETVLSLDTPAPLRLDTVETVETVGRLT